MQFPKDILVLDFEGRKHPVQVGAVLLDRKSLEEKSSFISYIFADLQGETVTKSGITQKDINDAPSQAEVGTQLYKKFGADVFLAPFVQNLDLTHFQTLMIAAGLDFSNSRFDFERYDFHILDIWPLAYIHLLKNGYEGSAKSEEIFQAFGAEPRQLHDALEDCRLAAHVLKKIILQ